MASTSDEGEDRGGGDAANVEPAGPPMPDSIFRIVNPVVKTILGSPLHGLLSDDLLVLRFAGRKSGDEYAIPVGYRRANDTLHLTTHSQWWHNFRDGGRGVEVLLRGEWREGHASAHPDPERVAAYVRDVLETEGIDAARRLGLRIEGDEVPNLETLERGLEETVLIEVELTDETPTAGQAD